jgi:hypothetical protein
VVKTINAVALVDPDMKATCYTSAQILTFLTQLKHKRGINAREMFLSTKGQPGVIWPVLRNVLESRGACDAGF